MLATLLKDRDEPTATDGIPHLSHSRINRYLVCPEQYRLYYLELVRPKVPAASLVFGNIVHQAMAEYFATSGDPVKRFLDMWTFLANVPLSYGERDSFEKLKASGQGLIQKFLAEEATKVKHVRAVEKPFKILLTGLTSPFVGVIDLIAEFDGDVTVIDWKTAAASYSADDADLADQLTAYQLAEPGVSNLALCVLVKTKEPKIQWQVTRRSGEIIREYVAKVGYVAEDITAKRFFKRPGPWCSWCDYRPLCAGHVAEAKATLVTMQ